MKKIKAISLVSGGLDSILATKLMAGQGLDIIAVNFLIPFCHSNKKGKRQNEVDRVFQDSGVTLRKVSVYDELLNIVKTPQHGYGSNVNPCIDCKIMMLKKAKQLMEEEGVSFVITGEVLGQRPMSQNRNSLNLIEKESGLEGLILRPLSAKLLPETLPEKMGWVDRQALLDINGRGRKAQLELAKELGIKDYPAVAGGCLLTDPAFSQRVKDLIEHHEWNLQNVELLKLGRHFRLADNAKLVVGRDETENNRLEKLVKDTDWVFMPYELNGPFALGRGSGFNQQQVRVLSGSIVSRYCDRNGKAEVAIKYAKGPHDDGAIINTLPLEEAKLKSLQL